MSPGSLTSLLSKRLCCGAQLSSPGPEAREGGCRGGGRQSAERDTVGMLKQGHQSHRDLNLSKLALQSEDRRHGKRFHISPDNTASALR